MIEGFYHLRSGGSWNYSDGNCVVSVRGGSHPYGCDYSVGFRIAIGGVI